MYSKRRYYFLSIADTLNITHAAAKLHISQPSLTQYLSKLEDFLGLTLVDRHYTPLRLTPAGIVYAEYLRQSQKADDELFKKLNEIKAGMAKPLTIGIPMQKSHELTAVVLPKFIGQHSNINISIWEGTSSTVRERVAQGELDIGFCHAFTADDEACFVKPLNNEKIVIICSANNPLLEGKKTTPASPIEPRPRALEQQLFYQMSTEYFLYEVGEMQLKKYGIKPKQRLVMSNLLSIMNNVARSEASGFAFMPDYVLADQRAKDLLDQLGYLRLGSNDLDWHFCMLKKKGKAMTREAKLFWDCVIDSCCEL